jgi:hypothetical protein
LGQLLARARASVTQLVGKRAGALDRLLGQLLGHEANNLVWGMILLKQFGGKTNPLFEPLAEHDRKLRNSVQAKTIRCSPKSL